MLIETLKEKAAAMKNDLPMVYYAFRHPRVGPLPKILIFVALAYALSPIDLIPDFIPVIGLLDDLLFVPALIYISLLLISGEVLAECRAAAAAAPPVEFGGKWFAAGAVILIWLFLACLLFNYLSRFLSAGHI